MRFLKCYLIFFIVLISRPVASAQDRLLDAYVDQLGKQYLTTPGAVGLSIGVWSNGKSSAYHFGTVKRELKQLPTSQTIYELGSISKVFASTLLARAVLDHKVKLDDDIRKYLPGSYPNLVFEGREIRVVDLANLSSGLPNWIPDAGAVFQNNKPDSIPYALLAQHRNYTKAQFYQDLHNVKLTYAPGVTPKHSNAAAQLLGFILEDVYKQPFANLVRRYITGPLKMEHTTMPPVKSAELAVGYNAAGVPMPYIDTEDFRPSSELSASTLDMIKFLKYQLDPKEAAIKLSHERTLFSKQDTTALNWHVDRYGSPEYNLWHTGGTFGFSSYIVLYPGQKTGIILMANENDATTQNKLATIASQIMEYVKKVSR